MNDIHSNVNIDSNEQNSNPSTADVCEVVGQLARFNSATRQQVVSVLAQWCEVSKKDANSAVRVAMMKGEVHEPRCNRLARVNR